MTPSGTRRKRTAWLRTKVEACGTCCTPSTGCSGELKERRKTVGCRSRRRGPGRRATSSGARASGSLRRAALVTREPRANQLRACVTRHAAPSKVSPSEPSSVVGHATSRRRRVQNLHRLASGIETSGIGPSWRGRRKWRESHYVFLRAPLPPTTVFRAGGRTNRQDHAGASGQRRGRRAACAVAQGRGRGWALPLPLHEAPGCGRGWA
jgi:hypothetical protein